MACNAAGLVDKETEGAPKLDELADLLEELCIQSGLKSWSFPKWELMTRMVEGRVLKMGLGCVRLHGGVHSAQRGQLMDRFREDDAIRSSSPPMPAGWPQFCRTGRWSSTWMFPGTRRCLSNATPGSTGSARSGRCRSSP